MLDIVRGFIIDVINSTYLLLVDTFGFLDTPGTYLVIMVTGFVFVPFFVKDVYYQYANPHGHYSMPVYRKAVMGIIFIAAWILFGYANFIRFLPPA